MKYTVKMSCGHEQDVELYGKSSERERKLEYFENFGLCSECYRKKKQEQTEGEGLVFNASILPFIDQKTGSIQVSVWFSGNTKPYKDDIKSLGGYWWSEREGAEDLISLKRPPLCWNKVINISDLKDEVAKATSIGAENVITDEGLFSVANYQIALKMQKNGYRYV